MRASTYIFSRMWKYQRLQGSSGTKAGADQDDITEMIIIDNEEDEDEDTQNVPIEGVTVDTQNLNLQDNKAKEMC